MNIQDDDLTGFENHLIRETGKQRSLDVNDVFKRRRNVSTYYANKASDLHAGAVVIWNAYQAPVGLFELDTEAERLGLGKGFQLGAALPPVFLLLAGLAIELQIKAVARLLGLENPNIHRMADLSNHIGILLSTRHAALAAALTEYVYWASRYPTPSSEGHFKKAQRIFIDAGPISLAGYESLRAVFILSYWRAKKLISEP